MCAIVGFFGPGDRRDLRAMMSKVAHRGPDGSGEYADPERPLFLGHQRLAIIDIESGAQPMWDSAGLLAVTFNGEIYNHRELRAELEALGHRFTSDHSDTEVLIHGYRAWGEDLPIRLNGMFAFCIYDRLRQRLFLSRDRFGEKPLYFAKQGKLFAFASEISAFVAHRSFSSRLNSRSVQKFFGYGFLPAPNAILSDCEKLPGGASLTFDLRTCRIEIKRYWQFRIEEDRSWCDRPEGDLIEELRSLLSQSVKRRLVADVPLGFFLSGGVDSSAVLATAAQLLPQDHLKTFTLGFDEPSFDESAPAARVAEAFGATHALQTLDLRTARDSIVSILERLDEPSGDASILPTALLARFTRQHVTVALSGDGADELFAGYDPFSALAPARAYKAMMPAGLHRLARRLVSRAPISDRNMSWDFRLRRTLSGLTHNSRLWNPIWLAPAEPELVEEIFRDALSPEELYEEAVDLWDTSSASLVNRSLEFYTTFYLQDGVLNKVDRGTMMSALESRAVFLDNDLVRFCQNLPQEFKLNGGRRKYLLKKAMLGLLANEVMRRPKKGFGMPTAKWLRSIPAQVPLREVDGINMGSVEAAWRDHRSGDADHRLFLWGWLSLQCAQGGGLTPVQPLDAPSMAPTEALKSADVVA